MVLRSLKLKVEIFYQLFNFIQNNKTKKYLNKKFKIITNSLLYCLNVNHLVE